jgi:hypothetical protein
MLLKVIFNPSLVLSPHVALLSFIFADCYGSGILCHVVTCTSAGWHRRCGAAEPEYL